MQKITVNGQVISPEAIQFDLERLIRFHAEHGMPQEQIRAQLPELQQQAVEQAIGERLLLDESRKLDFPIAEQEIDEEVERITAQLGGQEAFERALAARKTSLATFREQLKTGKRMEKLVAKITENTPAPTEVEIAQHFRDHKQEYTKSEEALASHILITPDGTEQLSKDEAREKISSIRQKIICEGADFSDMAEKHSACPSAEQGGSLGWFGRGAMVPEFDKAVFSMQDGEISDIIETQFGYHIIKKLGHKDAAEPQFDEVREQIRDFLLHERRGERLSAYVEELKAKADIVRE
ncbi:MAG: peptidylprolyl isomerase [Kiritimatiellae bacterium]|nr:peptidylprolyl isomerase [Kiritimatiellia bacterium]